MECLISIGAKIAEYAVAPIGRQLGYFCFYKRNVDELKAQLEHLGNAEKRLQRRVDEAKRNGEEIEADVQDLLTNIVPKIIIENKKFIEDEVQANTKCCTGAFSIPNLVLRHRLSRRAKKNAQDIITQIIQDVQNFDNKKISYCPCLPTSVENEGYEEFETRKQTVTKIMEALRDPNVCILGVWGMGGVGKTMLAKEVARLAKDQKLFTEVVFTTISATPSIEKILDDIRKCLGMDKNDDIVERIKNRLGKENDLLVIVDDVWKKSIPVIEEFAKVGICFGENKKGCKILLTSREYRVLNNDMTVDRARIFHVGVLSEDEALRLFSKIVGDKANEPGFCPWATKIVEECGGLPIAVTTVASALKNESSLDVWKSTLHELTKSGPGDIEDMDEKVYRSISLSYHMIQSESAKKLFLLCSLFEEDAVIPVTLLCNYAIGLNMFQGCNKVEDARNKTVTLVKTLKDRSLLLWDREEGDDSEEADFVTLHDVIRDVVISIASKDDEPMCNIGNVVDELEEYLVKSTAISLSDITADQYPETLKSPMLKLLRLNGVYGNNVFQHHFFKGLDQLLVLDLNGVSLKRSPTSSFCLLQSLQVLHLNDCSLGDITWIGELNKLKILDLSCNASVAELPKEIGKLNRLLSLNLQGCGSLKVIRPNVISRLTRLEELNLNSFTTWEDGEGVVNGDDERPNANLGEVKNLRHLTNLSLRIPDVKILPNNMFSDKLDKFDIEIGNGFSFHYTGKSERILKLNLCADSVLNKHDFEVLLKKSEFLHLIGLKNAKSVAYELGSMGIPQLKKLIIEDCAEILCILNSSGNIDNSAAFGKLREIHVTRCQKMKSLFPISNIPKQLETIRVKNCEVVEEIISDGREGDLLNFSELHELVLVGVPKLVQFKATRKSAEIRDGVQSIDVSVVPLFNREVVFSKLKNLKLERLNVGKIWNGDQLRSLEFGFQSLTTLYVDECHELKGLIPSSVAISLVHLRQLRVTNCEAMEEIVFIEESTQEATTFGNISFPKLEALELKNLPNLKKFCAGDCVDCSSLSWLQIQNCPKLREFLTNSMPTTENENIVDLLDQEDKQLLFNPKVVFSKLKNLKLERLNVGKIWNGDQLRSLEFGFQSLTTLDVDECHELKGLIPSSVAISLVHLQELRVWNCKAMEEIVFIEESTQETTTFGNILFPKLETLELRNLPNLECFCAGNCLDCSSLLKLEISDCPKFWEFLTNSMPLDQVDKQVDKQRVLIHKVAFPKLYDLQLAWLNIGKIWNGDQLRWLEFGFQSLTTLTVMECHELKGLIPSSVAISLVHLRELHVSDCMAMEEIVFIEESTQEAMAFGNISFPKLETLELRDLPNLECFCTGNCFDYSSLLKLEKTRCPIRYCPKFWDFSTNSMPLDQVDKQRVLIHKVVLPKLEELKIERLIIGKIWNGDQLRSLEFGFQSLTTLYVVWCHELKGLIPSSVVISLVHLRELHVRNCKAMEEIVFIEESTQEAMAFGNISFPKLETLQLWNLPNLECFCAGNCLDCSSLLKLEISDCPKFWEFLTNSMPLDQVDKQRVLIHKVVLPKLEELEIRGLNIGKIWNGDQLRWLEFGFQSLTTLTVMECHELKGLIPSSVATSLVHLRELHVRNCKAMEEIVFIEESTQEATTFGNISFPKLETLQLWRLPNLECFYCKAMKEIVFIEESTQEATTFGNISFPKLKTLQLQYLPNLERFCAGNCVDWSSMLRLEITDCPKFSKFLTNFMPLDQVNKQRVLIHKDPVKADELISTESSCSKITRKPPQLGSAVEEHHDTVFKMKRLKYVLLRDLPNLDQPHKTFLNVEELQIDSCDGLKVLAQPSVSLQTLTVLTVRFCCGLTSALFHRSTAKSLSRLRKMSIGGCPNLREVIADDNKEAHDDFDELADDIVFSQLESLILFDLSSLASFYSGDGVLKFPRLKNLVVDDCLGMKKFSHGNIDCSMVDKIVGRNKSNHARRFDYWEYDTGERENFANGDKWKHWWEGDINTTIQKLPKDENDSSFRRVTRISEESHMLLE